MKIEVASGELYITDNPDEYKEIKKTTDALIYLHSLEDIDKFPEGKYFVTDIEDVEADYFEKVYRRIHNIPWHIMDTKRLTLRETIEEDVDSFYEIYKDPEITKYTEALYQDKEKEREYTRLYREKVYAVQEFGIWTVIRKEDNRVIGRAGLVTRPDFEGVEIGFVIGNEFKGNGYATEAICGVLKYAKDNDLGPVRALVLPFNEPSKRLLEKVDFTYTENVIHDNTEYEVWCCTR